MKTLSEALKKAGINNPYLELQDTANGCLPWCGCLHKFTPVLINISTKSK
jgi:hypothetical protein